MNTNPNKYDFSPGDLPDNPVDLERWINEKEEKDPRVKANARSKIIWAEPREKKVTEYALVYLHGFKASHGEGDPVHVDLAKSLGCNLYLSRLEGHGLNVSEPLKGISASSFVHSAGKAFAIAGKIGKQVIIVGTSTGGSLALFLAAQPNLKTKIAALVLYSPLIEFYGTSQWVLGSKPGRKILKLLLGKTYMLSSELGSSEAEKKIWYHTYALQGVLALGNFIENTMTEETFSKVDCPVFIGCYYKNIWKQDKVVSVAAIEKMHRQLATENTSKVLKKFPEAGTHVICSGLISGSVENLKNSTLEFLNDKIGLNKP